MVSSACCTLTSFGLLICTFGGQNEHTNFEKLASEVYFVCSIHFKLWWWIDSKLRRYAKGSHQSMKNIKSMEMFISDLDHCAGCSEACTVYNVGIDTNERTQLWQELISLCVLINNFTVFCQMTETSTKCYFFLTIISIYLDIFLNNFIHR